MLVVSCMLQGKPQVLSKIGSGIKLENIGEEISLIQLHIGGEEDTRLGYTHTLP